MDTTNVKPHNNDCCAPDTATVDNDVIEILDSDDEIMEPVASNDEINDDDICINPSVQVGLMECLTGEGDANGDLVASSDNQGNAVLTSADIIYNIASSIGYEIYAVMLSLLLINFQAAFKLICSITTVLHV